MILPITVKALKLPRLVILFSVPGASMPLKVPPTILPVTARLPVTVAPVSPPSVLILGWLPCAIVPVIPPVTVKVDSNWWNHRNNRTGESA